MNPLKTGVLSKWRYVLYISHRRFAQEFKDGLYWDVIDTFVSQAESKNLELGGLSGSHSWRRGS